MRGKLATMNSVGRVVIEYDGRITDGLAEHLWTLTGVRVAEVRPLVLETADAEDLVNRIYPYLSDPVMRTTRVQLRRAEAERRISAA